MSSKPAPAGHDRRLLAILLAGSLPAWLVQAVLVWQLGWLIYPKILLLCLTGIAVIASVTAVHRQTLNQRRTISNLVAAIRVGDYSMRLRHRPDDALAELASEINQLASSLHQQRLKSEEALRLVDSVVEGIEVAIFAVDEDGLLRLANPAACQLLQQSSEQLLGQPAASMGLSDLLAADPQAITERVFPGGAGLWQLRRRGYRAEGRQHTLLFVNDLKQVLRSEELKAWRQLIRVLSHEVNNSLGPIASVSATLRKLTQADPLPEDCSEDLQHGLEIIEERAQRLGEFIRRYAALARLPEPHKQVFDLGALLQSLPALQPEAQLQIDGPTIPAPFYGDRGQIEQLLINLIKNGVEAGGTPVTIRWQAQPLQISVLDSGSGIANPTNLFVPFYTTKPEGSGIGLVLCRQIVEAHHGTLALQNREDGVGCVAVVRFAPSLAPSAYEPSSTPSQ
ncbi:sensor histidine kinase [Chitinimonas naiadis]